MNEIEQDDDKAVFIIDRLTYLIPPTEETLGHHILPRDIICYTIASDCYEADIHWGLLVYYYKYVLFARYSQINPSNKEAIDQAWQQAHSHWHYHYHKLISCYKLYRSYSQNTLCPAPIDTKRADHHNRRRQAWYALSLLFYKSPSQSVDRHAPTIQQYIIENLKQTSYSLKQLLYIFFIEVLPHKYQHLPFLIHAPSYYQDYEAIFDADATEYESLKSCESAQQKRRLSYHLVFNCLKLFHLPKVVRLIYYVTKAKR